MRFVLFVLLALISPAPAEYFHFETADGRRENGAAAIYLETRYPAWSESTYNARWFPGIEGDGVSTAFYSGPTYSDDPASGAREVGYIWSFWGVNQPLQPGDASVPLVWHDATRDVPSIGEGASGKIEGKFPMTSGVWYPTVTRLWADPADPQASFCGQWIQVGEEGRWQQLGAFRIPFPNARFGGNGGFIEDFGHGNRHPRRVDFRHAWMLQDAGWENLPVFVPSTRQDTEKGTAELIEDGSATFFETCAGEDYRGNMGPGAQERKLTLVTPDEPPFGQPAIGQLQVARHPGQLLLHWTLADASTPQFRLQVQAGGRTLFDAILPDRDTLLLDLGQAELPPGPVKLILTDVFDQTVEASAEPVAPRLLPAITPPGKLEPGLVATTCLGDWTELPEFAALPSEAEFAVNDLDATLRPSPRGFAVRYDGLLHIPTAGLHLFELRASDGARLWIDDQPAIDFDGLHGGGTPRRGALALAAGLHFLRIEHFKSANDSASPDDATLTLLWQPPGRAALERLPATHLGRVADPDHPRAEIAATPAGEAATDQLVLAARLKHGADAVRAVEFFRDDQLVGLGQPDPAHSDTWTCAQLQGVGAGRFRARFRLADDLSVDSAPIAVTLVQPDLNPWTFTPIGPQRFAPAASVRPDPTRGEVHTLLGDNLLFTSRRIEGDCTLTARIEQTPASDDLPEQAGTQADGQWTGGLLLRDDLESVPGTEMGRRFVALFQSVGGQLVLQDGTNHNGGGLFWPGDLQNAERSYRWLRLQRRGQVFTASASVDGQQWNQLEQRDLSAHSLPAALEVGLFTLARPSDNPNPNRWEFSQVTLESGAE